MNAARVRLPVLADVASRNRARFGTCEVEPVVLNPTHSTLGGAIHTWRPAPIRGATMRGRVGIRNTP
jgi:hypothetical protein